MKKYKKDCFAFIKEHPAEGCKALDTCECDNCSFYTTTIEHNCNLLQYPFDENYQNNKSSKKNNF